MERLTESFLLRRKIQGLATIGKKTRPKPGCFVGRQPSPGRHRPILTGMVFTHNWPLDGPRVLRPWRARVIVR